MQPYRYWVAAAGHLLLKRLEKLLTTDEVLTSTTSLPRGEKTPGSSVYELLGAAAATHIPIGAAADGLVIKTFHCGFNG